MLRVKYAGTVVIRVEQCKTILEGRLQRAEQQLARERLATSDELAVGEQRKLSDSANLRVIVMVYRNAQRTHTPTPNICLTVYL